MLLVDSGGQMPVFPQIALICDGRAVILLAAIGIHALTAPMAEQTLARILEPIR